MRCAPDTPLAEVVDLMKTQDVGSMLVCDSDDRPLGIFTLTICCGTFRWRPQRSVGR